MHVVDLVRAHAYCSRISLVPWASSRHFAVLLLLQPDNNYRQFAVERRCIIQRFYDRAAVISHTSARRPLAVLNRFLWSRLELMLWMMWVTADPNSTSEYLRTTEYRTRSASQPIIPQFQSSKMGQGDLSPRGLRPQCGSISHSLWFQSKLDTQRESTRFFL